MSAWVYLPSGAMLQPFPLQTRHPQLVLPVRNPSVNLPSLEPHYSDDSYGLYTLELFS